jgi:hypothetical protein
MSSVFASEKELSRPRGDEVVQRRAAVRALRSLLRPVVRRLVEWGIPYPALDEIVRDLYVSVADRELAIPFKRSTDSRVALLTGLHRKEVAKRRRTARPAGPEPRLEQSAAVRVVGRWMAPPYADAEGRPLALPYDAPGARARSFKRLVGELGVDAPPRSVLDELVRLGTAAIRPDGRVVLQREAVIADPGSEAALSLLGTDPAELFATIAHNVSSPSEPWLQRKVAYDNVGSEALAELRAAARELGAEFVRRANVLLAARDRDRRPDAPGGRRSRVSLGIYYFEAEAGDDAGGAEPAVPARPRRGAAPSRRRAGAPSHGTKGRR